MPTDPGKLLEALTRAVNLADAESGELDERLDELVSVAATVFDVAGAGLMLVDERSRLRLVGASNEAGRALEQAQQDAGSGPGIAATERCELITVEDFSTDHRWPEVYAAVARYGIVSVISAPIALQGQVLGNLNLFDRATRSWSQADRDGVMVFAGVMASLLRIALESHHRGQLVGELSQALTSDRIERTDG